MRNHVCSTRLIPHDKMDGNRYRILMIRTGTTSCCVNMNSMPSFCYRLVSNRWKSAALTVACPVLPISPKSPKVSQIHLLDLQLCRCGARADGGSTSVPSAGAPPICEGLWLLTVPSPTPCADSWKDDRPLTCRATAQSCKVAATCHASGPITDATTSQNPV